MKQGTQIRGYWFSEEDKLPYGDDRVVEIGATHDVEGPIVICENGLHFCESPLDALKYAPGVILWRIEAWGDLILEKDNGVARYRQYLWRLDATELLEKFSRWCALQVAHLWDAPTVVIEFLKTGDPLLRQAAYDAAETIEGTAYTAETFAIRSARAAAESPYKEQIDFDYVIHIAHHAGRSAANARGADSKKDMRKRQEQRLLIMIEEALQTQTH